MIFRISNIPSVVKGKEMDRHHGYYIMIPMDYFYVLDNVNVDYYTACLYSKNQVMLKIPAFPYSLLNQRDEIAKVVPDIVTDGLDNARHYFVGEKSSREFKYILLNFPHGHELSASEIYADAGGEEDMEIEILKIKFKHSSSTEEITQYYAAWKVARLDIRPDKRGKPDMPAKSKAAMALAKAMGGAGDARMKGA